MSAAAAAAGASYRACKAEFIRAGVTSPQHACPLAQVTAAEPGLLRRLKERGILKKAGHERYWFDLEEAGDQERRALRTGFWIMLAFAVPLLLLAWFLSTLV